MVCRVCTVICSVHASYRDRCAAQLLSSLLELLSSSYLFGPQSHRVHLFPLTAVAHQVRIYLSKSFFAGADSLFTMIGTANGERSAQEANVELLFVGN